MSTCNQRLPKCGEWLLQHIISREVRDSALGDFEELYNDLRREKGITAARLWFWKQIILSLPSFLYDSVYWSLVMLKNYIKTAIRNLKRQKVYSLINISGLSVGLACCILIVLYIRFELSFDGYHERAERIYRIIEIETEQGKKEFSASTPAPMAPALAQEFPEIDSVVRVFHPSWEEKWKISTEDKTFFEENVFFADPSILEVFTFPLIRGSRQEALKEPNSVVITRDMAEKYFGDSNPLGKTLAVRNIDAKISGVAQDIPRNSHFRFDFLFSFSTLRDPRFKNYMYDMLDNWRSHNFYSYLLLREGSSSADLEKKFIPFLERHFNTKISGYSLSLQALRDVRLHSRNFAYDITTDKSDIAYIYIFSAIALFVLIVACINYMNLTTARATTRLKEVGTRKMVGASRLQLVQQFLSESVVLLFIALVLAFILTYLFLPLLNTLAGSTYALNARNLLLILGMIFSAALLLGISAGIYPALFLSTFHPLGIIKGNIFAGMRRVHLRSILVVVQFAISIVLIVGTFIIHNQLRYCMKKNLGFDKEHVLVIPARDYKTMAEFESIKSRLLHHPEVLSVARSSSLPGKTTGRRGMLPEGKMWSPRYSIFVDYDFIPTMGMEIVGGRNFSREFVTDIDDAYIVNETAVKEFGWDSGLGKKLIWAADGNKIGQVVGVVKDFHFASLHQKIEPIVLHMMSEGSGFSYMTIRVSTQDMPSLLGEIKKEWREFNPAIPFEFFFLDDSLNSLYRSEKRMGRVSGIFTFLAILISCLGLFGLASYVAEQRTKEIGIRKVLGATSSSIVFFLSKEFTKLVLISNLIAWPVAYFAMNKWLQNFAYRINISLVTFLAASVIALVIALLSVSYQSIKSGLSSPVDALRYE